MWTRSDGSEFVRKTGRVPSIAWIAVLALVGVALLTVPAFADGEYRSARTFAESYGLSYRVLTEGDAIGCVLANSEHRIVALEGMRNVVLDGRVMPFDDPVRMNGDTITLPKEAIDLLDGRLGIEAAPPAEPATTDAPDPSLPSTPSVFRVVIDPGHGGRDPGASYGGLHEKTVNLDIALRLAKELRARDMTVVLTRTDDRSLRLMDRVAMANQARPDLFVSVHANAERSLSVSGAMTLYPADERLGNKPDIHSRARLAMGQPSAGHVRFGAAGPVARTALLAVTYAAFEAYRGNSIRAASAIQDALAPVNGTRPRNNGVIEDWRGLAVLSWVHAPAVLVEVDFLSNGAARRKLAKSAHRQRIAEALADGIETYLQATETEEGT